MTTIEWTDETWNPVTGCTKVSQGCKNCYAERVFPRVYGKQIVDELAARDYPEFREKKGDVIGRRPRKFTDVRTHTDRLDAPLHWKKPRRVFVNSMSDLFHDDVPFEFIRSVLDVCEQAKQHTFQILTKRADNMRLCMLEWMRGRKWPENLWLGVSVEDQATADERIPLLLGTPAAVRFVSLEPMLGPIDLRNVEHPNYTVGVDAIGGCDSRRMGAPILDWVICGGESGPKARPCDVAWIRSIVQQCNGADVPVFCKQLGANVRDRNDAGFAAEEETWADGPDAGKPTNRSAWPSPVEVEHDINGYREEYQGAPVRVHLRDRKGGDPSEWPDDLRVRQWPTS